jgi:hypothetical protein
MATRDTEKEIARLQEVKKRLEEERAINAQLADEKRQQLKDELIQLKLLYAERAKFEKQGKTLSQQQEDELKILEEKTKELTDINKKLKEQGTLIDANEKKQKRLLEESEKLFESTKRQLKQNYQVNKSLDDLGKALEKNKKLNQQFTEGFAAQEQQLDVINSILSKRGDITDKELANIQKFKKAQTDYQKGVADIQRAVAEQEMSAEAAAEAMKRLKKTFVSVGDSMEFTSQQGKAIKVAIDGAVKSGEDFGKQIEKVNKRTADIKSGFDEIKGQIGSTVPMAKELLDVFSKIGKVGFSAALAGLAATAGKLLNEKGLAKKAIPGIKDRLDIENDFKRKNFDEYQRPLAKMNFETDIEFSKQSFDVDQKYAKKDFARQQRMSATMHGINMANKQKEAEMTFKSEASMAYFGKALPSIGYAANQLQNAGISADAIANASVSIAQSMGVGGKESAKLGTDMAVFAKFAGIGAEEAGNITESFKLMDGVSAGTAANMMQGVKAMAEQLDLNPGAVMKEMASASEIALEMNISSGKALAKQVGYATSLGVSFSKIAKAGQNMVLNYKDSIKSEMQLSALLGKQVDLSEVRMKFAEGDTTGAMEALKAQGLDPNQMDMFQKQALQQATGMDISDLSKIGKGKGKDAEALDSAATKIDKASIHAANKHLLAAETTRQITLDNKKFALEQATAQRQFDEQLKMDREAFEDNIEKKREEFEIQQNLSRAQLENEITMSRKLQELELQKELANLGNTILFELIPALLAFGASGGANALGDLMSMVPGRKGKKGGRTKTRTNKSKTTPQSSAQRRTAAMANAAPRPAAPSTPAAPVTKAQQVAQLKAANPGMTSQQALQQVKTAPAGGAPSGPAAAAPKPPTGAPKAPTGGGAPKIAAPAAPPAPAMPPAPKIPAAAPIAAPKMSWWEKLNPKKFLGKVVSGAGGVGKILGSVAGKVAGPLGSALGGFSMYKDLSALVTMNEGPLPDLYKNVGGSVMSLVGSILGGAIGGSFLGPIGAMLGSTFGSTVFGWLGDLFPGIPTFLGEFLVDTLGLFGKPGSAVPKAEGGGGGAASAPTAAGTTSKATAIVGTSQAVKSAAAPTAAPSGGGGAPKSTPAPAGGGVKAATPGATGTSTKGSALAGGLTGMLMGVQLQKIFGPTNSKTEGFIDQAKADSLKQTQAIQLQTKAITNAKGLPTQDTTMQQQLNDLLKVMTAAYGNEGGQVTILLDGQKVSKTINKVNSNNDLTGGGNGDGPHKVN